MKEIINILKANIKMNGYRNPENFCPSEQTGIFFGLLLHVEYILPFGLTANEINELLLTYDGRSSEMIVNSLYDELLVLNPSLTSIANDGSRDNFKYHIILGAVSKFSVADIAFFINEEPITIRHTPYSSWSPDIKQGMYTKHSLTNGVCVIEGTNYSCITLEKGEYDEEYNRMLDYLTENFPNEHQYVIAPENIVTIYNRAMEMEKELC